METNIPNPAHLSCDPMSGDTQYNSFFADSTGTFHAPSTGQEAAHLASDTDATVVYATNSGGEIEIPTSASLNVCSSPNTQQNNFESKDSKTPIKKTRTPAKKATKKIAQKTDQDIQVQPEALKKIFETFDVDKARAELCKRDFFFFVKEFWDTVVTQPAIYNWHIEYLCKELQRVGWKLINREKKEADIIINVPPGATKSTIVSIMFPAWLWCIQPNIKIISGCYAATLSNELSTKSRTIIESERYKKYFPVVKIREDQNVKSNFQTTLGGARYTTSTGSAITGLHADLILVDDPQNPELANSATERERTNTWVSETLSSRKTNREVSLTVLVQQRLHPNDVTGYLLARGKNYNHICLPAEINKTLQPASLSEYYIDGLLDVNRLSHSVLAESRQDLGSKGYNTQMLQQPQSDEDSIIRESWLPVITQEEYNKINADNTAVTDFYIDTAYTEKTKNDPSALLACSKIKDTLYITNVVQQWKTFPDLVKFIKTFAQNNNYSHGSRISIEPKANGISVVQQIRSETGLNIFQAPNPVGDKLTRLNAIAPTVERGDRVVLVKGAWVNLFLSEVTAVSPLHDDMRDVFVMAVTDKLIRSKNYGKYKIR